MVLGMRILATGDLHIGRSSARIPDVGDPAGLRSAAAWERIVAYALAEGVDLVLLTGDIVDGDNGFWEAYGPLERGIVRLGEEQVGCVAVAGNHDHQVLHRLARHLPDDHFRLLGEDGWERWVVEDRLGTARLAIDGWSFTSSHMPDSALASYALPPPDVGVPLLGMVHGDLGVSQSPYNPLDSRALLDLPPRVWVLGHVHQHRMIGDQRWICYPGSPQALDPGEPGPHGPVLFELVDGRFTTPRLAPMSSVAYHGLEIDCTAMTDEAAVEGHILQAIRDQARPLALAAGDQLRHLSLRLTLSGTCPFGEAIEACCRNLRSGIDVSIEQAAITIERVDATVIPPVDLEALATSRTAIGTAARLLLELEDGHGQQTPETTALLRDTRQRLLAEQGRVGVDGIDLDDAALRQRLARQTRRILLALLGTPA